MYLAQVFAILVVLNWSSQSVFNFDIFDEISNISEKGLDALKSHNKVQDCDIKLKQKLQDKINKDVNNTVISV